MMVFTHRHRSDLICDEKQIIIELFWHAWQGGCYAGGCFRWRCFPRVHVIAGCIGDGSGTCHLLITQRVMLWLGNVSLLYWTKCHIFIGPHGVTTIPRVSFFYLTTCLNVVCPRVSILLGHVSRPELPTFLFLI